MPVEDGKRFQLSNKCCICNKLFTKEDNYSAYSNCNINLRLTKKVPVIFHNLKGYDCHFIMQEISRFDVEISVIPNRLEKYLAFTINKNLVFIDSMQFMNSRLDALVKNFPDNDFQHYHNNLMLND